jgi:hypothetical protein
MVICSLLALIFAPNLFLLSLNLQEFQVGGFQVLDARMRTLSRFGV